MKSHKSVEELKNYCIKNEIYINELLITDIENKHIELSLIPTGKVVLHVLMKLYKNWISTNDLKKVSNQSAKPCQILRDIGFQFEKNNKKGDFNTYFICYEKGIEGRKIIDFYKNISVSEGKVKLSAKEKKVFLLQEVDFLTGSKDKLQIDHRCPIQAIIKAGVCFPDLNTDLASKELDKKYYQGLTNNSNLHKKSACQNCLNGHDIKLPPLGKELVNAGYVYKLNFEDNFLENRKNEQEYQKLPCFGCFYFNHAEPLRINK